LRKTALLLVLFALAGTSLLSCYHGVYVPKPPSGLYQRVVASQDVSSLTSAAGLVIINGKNDTLARASEISAGASPGLMVLSPTKATLLAFDAGTNSVEIVNTKTEASSGSVRLPGPTTSMAIASQLTVGYAAVPTAPLNGFPPGAVVIMDLTAGSIVYAASVPSARTIVPNPNGAEILAFSNDSDVVTIVTPLTQGNNTTATITTVPGFDRPVAGIFNGNTVYILNCGTECGGALPASVQMLNLSTTPPTAGTSVPVDGATVGLINGSTLYVAGTSSTNNACTGETTAAQTCGRLDTVDLGSFTKTGSAVITDGYHTVMSMSNNGQLFIGSRTCTNVGNVNNASGEVRGCLSIYNTTNGQVVIPPDNGDVTGLQNFTSRSVEYVAEGGNLRVYDTLTNKLQVNGFTSAGTIVIVGQVIDVKAIDFF
jgi:hypothetical protein